MKKIIGMTICLLLICLCFAVSAEILGSGTCGESLTWSLDSSGLLTISGTGDMADYGTDSRWDEVRPWKLYEDNIVRAVIQPGVTGIGVNAFYFSTSLTSVSIADTVTRIGERAFYHCSGLKEVTLPDSVTSLGDSAFFECQSLASVTLSRGLSEIGFHTFKKCYALASVTIPGSVHKICNSAFSSCTGLKELILQDGVAIIGNNAFESCTSLRSVTLPKSMTSLGAYAFTDCSGLESISFPNSLTVIPARAVANCTSLKSLTIPDSVTMIGDYAFCSCFELTSLTLPKGLTWIGTKAFWGGTMQGTSAAGKLQAVTLYDKITSIGEEAFFANTVLRAPTGSYAAQWARDNGYSLETFTLPSYSVTITTEGCGRASADPASCTEATPVTLTAEADEGWTFSEWKVLSGGISVKDNRFIMGTADVKIRAVFTPILYTVTITSAGHGSASADPASGVSGTEITLTAVPDQGYRLLYWQVLAGDVVIENDRFTIGTTDVEIMACFEEIPPEDISDAEIGAIKDQVYTGKKLTPKVTVKFGGKKLKAGQDYLLSWKNNKNIGTAIVTVKGTGRYTGSVKATFQIIPKAVSLTSLKAGKGKLTAQWKKGSSITGYEIEYSLKKNFPEEATNVLTISKASKTGADLKGLIKGKTYYVRIRTFRTVKGVKYYSAWSKAKKAKVK